MSIAVLAVEVITDVTTEINDEPKDKWYLEMCHREQKNLAKYPSWHIDNQNLYKQAKLKYPYLYHESSEWLCVRSKERRKFMIKK